MATLNEKIEKRFGAERALLVRAMQTYINHAKGIAERPVSDAAVRHAHNTLVHAEEGVIEARLAGLPDLET